MKILTLSVLSLAFLAGNSAHAASAELLKAAIDAADKAGLTEIKSITETNMYRCVKCYAFEVKGSMPAAPGMDATAKVATSGTMTTTDHPGVTNASVGEITLTPKPQPPTEDSDEDHRT